MTEQTDFGSSSSSTTTTTTIARNDQQQIESVVKNTVDNESTTIEVDDKKLESSPKDTSALSMNHIGKEFDSSIMIVDSHQEKFEDSTMKSANNNQHEQYDNQDEQQPIIMLNSPINDAQGNCPGEHPQQLKNKNSGSDSNYNDDVDDVAAVVVVGGGGVEGSLKHVALHDSNSLKTINGDDNHHHQDVLHQQQSTNHCDYNGEPAANSTSSLMSAVVEVGGEPQPSHDSLFSSSLVQHQRRRSTDFYQQQEKTNSTQQQPKFSQPQQNFQPKHYSKNSATIGQQNFQQHQEKISKSDPLNNNSRAPNDRNAVPSSSTSQPPTSSSSTSSSATSSSSSSSSSSSTIAMNFDLSLNNVKTNSNTNITMQKVVDGISSTGDVTTTPSNTKHQQPNEDIIVVEHHSQIEEGMEDNLSASNAAATIADYNYNKLPHWSQNIVCYELVSTNDCLISGGSDFGQMPYFTESGEIILEIDCTQVSGLTSTDIETLLANNVAHSFKVVTGLHGLPIELREYLSRRFARGSIDHKLQELIRDNIYSKTLPVTTRPPREDEADGVDYRFISKEQFFEMERSGRLLESGVYCNHYYGTPLPMINGSNKKNFFADSSQPVIGEVANVPSLKMTAKRKRNRSNIVAIDSASLPYGWERISDAHYGVYYIDHINKRTQYERPYEIELIKGVSGFGFTLIELDKGLVVVKSLIQGGSAASSGVIQPGDVLVSVAGVSVCGLQHSDIAHLFSTFNVGDRVRLTFARGYQLPLGFSDEDYDIITLKIFKGYQGFGFTISEGHNGQKVKKILDLERCCSLRQSDILLSINGIDLTSMSHLDVVETLKQCQINEPTEFMVKRKKRFRSKTPVLMRLAPEVTYQPIDDQALLQSRNTCETPNLEAFYDPNQQIHHQLQQRQQQQQQQQQQPQYNKNYIAVNNIYYDDLIDESNFQRMQTVPIDIYSNQNSTVLEPQQPYNNNDQMNLYSNQLDYRLPPPPPLPISSQSVNFTNQSQAPLLNNHNTRVIASPSNFEPELTNMNNSVVGEVDYEYHQVSLARNETGFGFRIVGGSEEGSNVAIGSIVVGGSASKEGTLKAGDEIVSINDNYVMGASHQDVVHLMSQTGPIVTILVRRKRYLSAYDVTLQRQDYEGFGFVIISCGNCALIGRIIEGSPAHRCQRLHIRDRIIAVNGNDVTNMSHPEIVNKIKESGDSLQLRIIPADCYTVELIRGPSGYGFSIRGGAEFNGMPLFILCIAPNGPASSLLQVGDEILEINDQLTFGMTHSDAVRLIGQSGPSVRLRLRHNSYANNPDGLFSRMSSPQSVLLEQQQLTSQPTNNNNIQPTVVGGGSQTSPHQQQPPPQTPIQSTSSQLHQMIVPSMMHQSPLFQQQLVAAVANQQNKLKQSSLANY